MKMFRSLYQWGFMYILFAIFMVGFFWEEKLRLTSVEHKLLAIGMLLSFSWILGRWIMNHEKNFLDTRDDE